MFSVPRLATAALLAILVASAAQARTSLLPRSTGAKLRHAAKAREKVSLPEVSLGRASLDTIELEPMELWTADAKIVVHGQGNPKSIDPPDTKYFRGRVKGEAQSAVFLAVADKKMHGLVIVGDKRFAFGTAKRVDRNEADDTIGLRELEDEDDPSPGRWTCDVDSKPVGALGRLTANGTRREVQSHAGNNVTSSYRLRLAIETDYELYTAFNSVEAITAYIESLVGNASVIFQRDLNTTLTLGNLQIHSDPQDPWTTVPLNGSIAALAQLANYWRAVHGDIQRSAVVMISGKAFNAGRAFQGTLCGSDFSCGIDGSVCGNLAFANGWGGAYAFCGTNGQPTVTIPDPTAILEGVTYAMPSTNDYWMLYLFAHEVGHLANAPHTNCVQLTYEERVAYNVQRAYVDECVTGILPCFAGSISLPSERGTIMSGCNPDARYIFWEPNAPSAKMQGILRQGIDNATPDSTIRLGSYANPNQEDPQPLACEAGRTAHVPACPSCSYAWSITGGSITSSTAAASITYTPSAPLVTLTVTITQSSGCAITNSRTVTTTCASVAAPAGFTATASSANTVILGWSAVNDASKYEVFRKATGADWSMIGVALSNAFVDVTAAPNSAYVYRVRGLDAGGYAGTYSAIDIASTFLFTDSALAPHATPIRAAHIEELRGAVNGVRALAGLAPVAFDEPSLASSKIKRAHIEDLRLRLSEGLVAIGRPAPSFTDPVLSAGSVVRTAHIGEIRAAMQ